MSIKTTALVAALTWLAAVAAPPVHAAGTAARQPAPTLQADATQTTRGAATPARTRARADDDAQRYARREAKAKKQAEYKGGDLLVVGISTGAAIVILIIVLLLI